MPLYVFNKIAGEVANPKPFTFRCIGGEIPY